METRPTDAQVHKYQMTWEEAYERAEEFILKPTSKINGYGFGIPRGGTFVAAMICEQIVDDMDQAKFLVDDIVDTGKTARRWGVKTGLNTYALVNKLARIEDKKLGWVVFPWEKDTDEQLGPTDNIRRLIEFIGEDPDREGLKDTPARVIKSFEEMTAGYKINPADILSKTFNLGTDEMVLVRGIRFTSLCEHHLLPFTGTCAIGYIPNPTRLVGLSKLPRVVQAFSSRLQVQERLTHQIAKAIMDYVIPEGVGVVMKAHHNCIGCRGVRQPDAEMVTSCMLGIMRDNGPARAELLSLL